MRTDRITKIIKNDNLLFFLAFVIFSMFYYDGVLDKGPLNVHIWRQTDCLSITRNYAEGASFLNPQMDVLFADDLTSGKTAGEFPIMYYIVGKVWSVFGESILFYRLFYLSIIFAGVFAFYNTLKLVFQNKVWPFIMALLLFTSPVFVTYGVSFLTDAPAFCFVLIALYFITKYYFSFKSKFFFWAMFFFAFGGLIKVSSLIAFFFILFIFLFEVVVKKPTLNKSFLFSRKWKEYLGFGLVFVSIFAWYFYAHIYNQAHGFKYTFNSIHPLWNASPDDLKTLPKGLKNFVSIVFFSRPILYLFLFIGIFNLFLYKKLPLIAYLANLLIILASIMYFILWAPLLGVHDYYYIALLILFIGILIPFLWYIKEHFNTIFEGRKTMIFGSIFLLFNFAYCLSVVKLKTKAQEGDFFLVGNHSFVEEMKWVNYDVSSNLYRYERIKPFLSEVGVSKEAKLICLPDPSFNTSLYLVNQKGWTNFMIYSSSEEIQHLINKGAEYLLISDGEYLHKEFLQPFLNNQIGIYEGLHVFKLK